MFLVDTLGIGLVPSLDPLWPQLDSMSRQGPQTPLHSILVIVSDVSSVAKGLGQNSENQNMGCVLPLGATITSATVKWQLLDSVHRQDPQVPFHNVLILLVR